MSEYPEHERLAEIAETSQSLGYLIELMEAKGYVLAKWEQRGQTYRRHCDDCGSDFSDMREETLAVARGGIQAVLADLFDIDLLKIDAEKDAMLQAIRAANTKRAERAEA
jgi:hypothetical protein